MGLNGSLKMGMFLESVSEQRVVFELGNHILYEGVGGQQFSRQSLALLDNGEGVVGFEGSKGSLCFGEEIGPNLAMVSCTGDESWEVR